MNNFLLCVISNPDRDSRPVECDVTHDEIEVSGCDSHQHDGKSESGFLVSYIHMANKNMDSLEEVDEADLVSLSFRDTGTHDVC